MVGPVNRIGSRVALGGLGAETQAGRQAEAAGWLGLVDLCDEQQQDLCGRRMVCSGERPDLKRRCARLLLSLVAHALIRSKEMTPRSPWTAADRYRHDIHVGGH